MLMSEEKLLEMIAGTDLPAHQVTWNELLREYITQLATVSKKLNRDEMAGLTAIGAILYQRGVAEFRSGIDEEALFAALKKRQAEEGK